MELYKINFILTLLIITIGLVIGMCLLLLSPPKAKHVKNYQDARIVMAISYFMLGLFMIGQILVMPSIKTDKHIAWIIVIALGAIQALSFTYSLISLINPESFTKQKLRSEIIYICVFCILNFVSYFILPYYISIILFTLFSGYYIFILIRYTHLFYNVFKEYKYQMDNYFSEQEWKRLKWISFTFYYALLIGIFAFLSLFSIDKGFVIFKAFIIPFYIYCGCHFVNYGFKFQRDKYAEVISGEELASCSGITPASFNELESLIDQWIKQKNYLRTGITIEQAAAELTTNRTYLSNYINTFKQQTFREWINHLRISEAKQLLLKKTELTASEIGKMVGFSDRSNFTRQFIKVTGMSPMSWKNKQ